MTSDNSYGQLFGDIFGDDAQSSYMAPHDNHFFRHQEPLREGFLLYGSDSHISNTMRSGVVSHSLHFLFHSRTSLHFDLKFC